MSGIRSILEQVRREAGGMLSVEVYARLYEAGRQAGGGPFVEVGTAQGAATIALALGAQSSGAPFHIYTVDPFAGRFSSRTAVGSVEANLALVQAGFARFGVSADITVIAGSTSDLLRSHDLRDIAVLMIDADGRIDRDLGLLLDRTRHNATVVIDDIDGGVHLHARPNAYVVDQKHRITSLLVDAFVGCGCLNHSETIGQTGFYSRGDAPANAALPGSILNAYHELVFAEVELTSDGLRGTLRQFLETRAPSLLAGYRRRRGSPR